MRDLLLILHFLGLALAVGSGFSALFLKPVFARLPQEQKPVAGQVMRQLMIAGPIGLAVLIVSGIFLTIPLWDSLAKNGLFHTKVTLVVIMLGLIGMNHAKMAKARREGVALNPPKVPLPFVFGLAVVVLAVLIFH